MLEIRRAAVSFEERDLLELERIMLDGDEKGAVRFLRKRVYDRIAHAQRGRLKSRLDGGGDPVRRFEEGR